MRDVGTSVLVARESSGMEFLQQLVGQVVTVIDEGVDSDGDVYMVVRSSRGEHLIYEDQCELVAVDQ